MATHEVLNQSGPLADLDLFDSDRAMVETFGTDPAGDTQCVLSADGLAELMTLGWRLGAADTLDLARLANTHSPVLMTFDRFGRRIDEVEFHPAWHALMSLLVGEGMHCEPWAGLYNGHAQMRGAAQNPAEAAKGTLHDRVDGGHVLRAAKYLLFSQLENGSQCPTTMTWAAIPLLAKQPALVDDWLPKLLSRDYDPRPAPLADRRCALVGMGMTEKQGGSDVRSNTTRAEPAQVSDFGDRWGRPYRITGHKWFMSAPMCDAFLVLAQADDALSCFLVPRWLPDGSRNRLQFQRLKNKLGNRSNASSEVEFDGTAGFLVGEPGRGIATILEMAALTRLDCAIASAGIMRRAVAEALHHATRRHAFGRPLVQQPLMTNVLADLALESEAAMRWVLRLAQVLDRRDGDLVADALLRVGTPLAKYWICRRAPALAFEAMEVLGGNGYVEEAPLARLYREAPVNSIWEGSGNIMCLDVLRALGREPACRDALLAELNAARGIEPLYDRFVSRLLERLQRAGGTVGSRAGDSEGPAGANAAGGSGGDDPFDPTQARRLAGDLARAWQAALMLRWAPSDVAAAFCAGRLDDGRASGDQAFGTLPASVDLGAIVERATPSMPSS